MTIHKSLAAVFLAAGSGLLQAEAIDTYELKPDLVVTPSRKVEPLDQSLSSISVITREEIERSVAEDLFELLRLQPGVDIVRTGGAGMQTSVFLRGGNSNHVLVLIDGVRVGSANTGAYAWEQLPLNQVERVEIVRGPRGSIYGSDSIGGVIHVFTRGSPNPYARVTGGSFGTAEVEAGLGYQGEATRLSVNAGYRQVGRLLRAKSRWLQLNPDNDGFEAANLGVKGSTESGSGRWEYSLLAIDSESEFDQGRSDARQLISSVGFGGQFSANWQFQLQGGYVRDQLFSDFGFFTTDFESRRYQFSWQNQLEAGPGSQFSFGLDYYREDGESADTWDENRDNVGLFAIWDGRFDRLHLQLGGRMDDNSRFGSEFTGQVAAGYDLGDAWQARASFGSAFRGPNLSEQFSPGVGGLFAGNPDLEPESSARRDRPALATRHSGTTRRRLVPHGGGRPDRVQRSAFPGHQHRPRPARGHRTGVRRGPFRLAFAATRPGRTRRTWIPARTCCAGRNERPCCAWTGSWTRMAGWAWSGSIRASAAISVAFVLDSYYLLNLRAGWSFRPGWRLELRGENLADEQYEPAYGFNAAGRAWFLSLAWLP
jgi:vitamin B12 transporter